MAKPGGRWIAFALMLSAYAAVADPETKHRWAYSSWLYTGTCLFAEVASFRRPVIGAL